MDSSTYHEFCPPALDDMSRDLLQWYRDNRRRLPWRGDPPPFTHKNHTAIKGQKNKKGGKSSEREEKEDSNQAAACSRGKEKGKEPLDPPPPTVVLSDANKMYGVWISEVMLQQTQVTTVVDYWLRWMSRWPSLSSLARASEDEVREAWAGLGYYSRAVNLLKAAQEVERRHRGRMPGNEAELLKLPGIGKYTAAALLSICHGTPLPAVDGNALRVGARLLAVSNSVRSLGLQNSVRSLLGGMHESLIKPEGKKETQKADSRAGVSTKQRMSLGLEGEESVIDIEETGLLGGERFSHAAGELNQAVMELGARVCTPTSPACDVCPLQAHCKAAGEVQGRISREREHPTDCALCVSPECEDVEVGGGKGKLKGGASREKAAASGSGSGSKVQPAGVCAYPLKHAPKAKPIEFFVAGVFVVRSRERPVERGGGEGGKKEKENADGEREGGPLWVLLRRRPEGGLLGGQWEVPSVPCDSFDENDGDGQVEQKSKKKKGTEGGETGFCASQIARLKEEIKAGCAGVSVEDSLFFSSVSENEKKEGLSGTSLGLSAESLVSSLRSARVHPLGIVPHVFSHKEHRIQVCVLEGDEGESQKIGQDEKICCEKRDRKASQTERKPQAEEEEKEGGGRSKGKRRKETGGCGNVAEKKLKTSPQSGHADKTDRPVLSQESLEQKNPSGDSPEKERGDSVPTAQPAKKKKKGEVTSSSQTAETSSSPSTLPKVSQTESSTVSVIEILSSSSEEEEEPTREPTKGRKVGAKRQQGGTESGRGGSRDLSKGLTEVCKEKKGKGGKGKKTNPKGSSANPSSVFDKNESSVVFQWFPLETALSRSVCVSAYTKKILLLAQNSPLLNTHAQ